MNSFRLLLAVLLATPVLRADVLVVDVFGGGDFTTLTAAVAAAAEGDTLLMREGEYLEPGPVIIEKALTVTGEWASSSFGVAAYIKPGLIVRNLAPGKHVVLQNLGLVGAPGSATAAATPGLTAQNNIAQLRVQNCVLMGGSGDHNNNPHGATAVDIEGGLSTAIVRCTVTGGQGQFSPDLGVKTGNGGTAIELGGGPVLVSHSFVSGGYGGSNIIGGWPDGGTGGTAIVHESSVLLLVGSLVNGGDGGTAHTGGDAGDGVSLGATGTVLFMGGSFASGGQGGLSDAGPDGLDGQDLVDPAGLLLDFGGEKHDFDLTSPLREGQDGTLVLGGDPADTTLMFVSLQPHQKPFTGYQGVLVLSPAALLGPFPIGAPGSQLITFFGPTLPVGVESLLVHVQPAYVGADGVVLGPGSVLTLLDAAF